MKPRHLLLLGAVIGILAAIAAAAYPSVTTAIMAWAGGILFGKGYGTLEAKGKI